MDKILTFDVGTTAIKTCVFDRNLQLCAQQNNEYDLYTEGGVVELSGRNADGTGAKGWGQWEYDQPAFYFAARLMWNTPFDMEKELDLIASGKKKKLTFLTEFYNTLENTVKNSPEIAGSPAASAEEKICPLCGAPMVVRRSRFGKLFYGCSKYPKCTGLVNIN